MYRVRLIYHFCAAMRSPSSQSSTTRVQRQHISCVHSAGLFFLLSCFDVSKPPIVLRLTAGEVGGAHSSGNLSRRFYCTCTMHAGKEVAARD
jgi:hypothetical protein